MQTILGSGGGAGTELARELINFTKDILLVSRNPRKVNESDKLLQGDLRNTEFLDSAIKGSEVVYVAVGFEYNTSIWQKTWPSFIDNLIHSCKKHNSKIVFIDNMYMYDPAHLSNMTEETPINPCSEKGKVRADIFLKIMHAIESGEISAVVARGADFYGPGVIGSYLTQTVYNNLVDNKNPQWLGKLDVIHSFTYSKDIGRAVALLGNSPAAYNQVWHLPTFEGKLTAREWIKLFMVEMEKERAISTVPVWAMSLLGLFMPIIKELKDISYQLDRDYYFNSSKFNEHFNFTPTLPETGVKEIVGNYTN